MQLKATKTLTPWGRALASKRPNEDSTEDNAQAAADPALVSSALTMTDAEPPVVLAQLDRIPLIKPTDAADAPAPSAKVTVTSTPSEPPAAMPPLIDKPEIGFMTRAASVMPGPEYLSSWMGPAPLGAVAGGAVLMGLALGGSGSKASSPTADTSSPLLLSAALNADGSKIILTYNEALSTAAPDKAAFAVTADGAAIAVSNTARGTANTSTVELTLASAITSLKTVQLSYTAPSAVLINGVDASTAVKDAASNRAANFTAQAVTVSDAVAPSVASATAYTSADASTVVLTYSEPLLTSQVPPVSAFVVTVNNQSQAISELQIAGNRVYLTLQNKIASGTSNANVITVAYASPGSDTSLSNTAVQDITGNDAPAISTPLIISNHSFELVAPTLKSASIDAAGKTVSLTMSEALDAAKQAPASAFFVQLVEGGISRSVAVASTSVSGDVVSLVLAERLTSSSAGLQVSYTDPSAGGSGPALQDLAGNNALNLVGASVANNIDTAAPSLSLASFKDSKTLVLTFTEALSATAAAAGAFSVTTNGAANSVTAVKVNGSNLELSLTNTVSPGQAVQLAYAAPAADNSTATNAALQDGTGNDAASISAYTVDTTAPALASTAGAVTGSSGNQIVLSFDSTMLASSYPAGSAFQVLGSQSGRINVSTVATLGNLVFLNLASALLPTETVSLSYAAPGAGMGTGNLALQDLAGNDLASLGSPAPLAVTNKIAPVLVKQSLVYDGTAGLNKVVLEFNDSFSGTKPGVGAFTVKVDNATAAVSDVTVSGSTVTLTLASPLSGTGAVTLGYTKPNTAPLADSDGNQVASFSGTSLGFLRSGTSAAETLTGTTGLDYFIGSLGNDALTGAGGADQFVWPSQASPGGWSQTIADFGFKGGSGSLQGSSEADALDLRALLTGYTAATQSQFLVAGKNADGKLVLNIDHDGGASFVPDAALVFDNISVNSANELLLNGSTINATAAGLTGVLTLGNLLTQWEADNQLRVL